MKSTRQTESKPECRNTRHATLLVILLITSSADFSTCSDVTEQLTTYARERFVLPCHTLLNQAVDWSFKPQGTTRWIHIYFDGKFVNGFAAQFAIEQRKSGEYNLVILNPQLNHTGEYKCEEDGGVGDVHRMNLRVTDIYSVFEIPTLTYIVTAGQLVRLPCHNSLLNISVNWISECLTKPDTVQISTSGKIDSKLSTRYRLETLSSGDNNLIIFHPELHDSSKYTCIENEGRGRRHQMHLIVIDKDKMILSSVGSIVAFGCVVFSGSRLVWSFTPFNTTLSHVMYDGESIANASIGHIEVITSSDRCKNALRIQQVGLEHSGKYTCTHEHDDASPQTYELGVLGSELHCSIAAFNYSVRGSQNFTIQCDIKYSGNLHPTIVCAHGLSTNIVLKQQGGLFTNSIPLSDNHGELSCHCKAAFNASYNPSMLPHALTWTTPNVLRGTELYRYELPTTRAETSTIVFVVLFVMSFAGNTAMVAFIIYKRVKTPGNNDDNNNKHKTNQTHNAAAAQNATNHDLQRDEHLSGCCSHSDDAAADATAPYKTESHSLLENHDWQLHPDEELSEKQNAHSTNSGESRPQKDGEHPDQLKTLQDHVELSTMSNVV